jgi:tetratricopeptide (TPR) repeat protein
VEAAIEARIGRLSDELREVLAVASVEGERFTAQVVARVQGISEREVLRALSQELEKRYRLVEEEQEVQVDGRFLSRYRFAHALFQQYLYGELSAGERRLLHGEIGDALEEIYQDQSHDIAVQLTHHYAEAGRREKTIEYSLHAGDQARLAYANEEAMDYYRRALALLDEPAPLSSRKDWRLEALKGLGQVCFGTGRVAEAEAFLREAIALGREMGLAPRELVRLYYWLGEVLWWQSRYDDRVCIGEEGPALLGDDTESVEAALMNQTIAGGLIGKENLAKCHEFTYRTAGFIRRLPYSEELRPAYIQIHSVYRENKDIEKAMEWLQALKERATRCHDLRALGEVRFFTGFTLAVVGDLRGAVPRFQKALELFTRIGDVSRESWSLLTMGRAFLRLGDRQKAEGYVDRALEAAKAVRTKREIAMAYDLTGRVSLCQGAWEAAVDAFQEAVELLRESSRPLMRILVTYHLGQTHLARGDRVEAREQFREAVALMGLGEWRGYLSQPIIFAIIPTPVIAGALSGLEEAYEDPEAFRAFCDRCRSQAGEGPLVQWYLEPAEPRQDFGLPILDFGLGADDFENVLSGAEGACPERGRSSDAEGSKIQNREWVWQDPFGDGSFRVRNGLEIHAANGRDLQYANLSAPRMLWPASGDWAVQTVCAPASGEKPAIGGLLLWQDKKNYLRLDRGATGKYDIFFGGSLGNQDILIGRGRLRESADQQINRSPGRVFLRLERIGDRVDALCSADGENWFTVGSLAFPVEDPVQVGLHAIGNIDRAVYRGAYPDGTAIRFESFQLWALNR